jgi:Uma2 family endonuclease
MDTIAPWAEPVLMTAEELFRLPEDGNHYELVDGRLVRMSPTGGEHGLISMRLLGAVYRFVDENHLGEVFPGETGFWISTEDEPNTVLAPDLAFVRAGQADQARTQGYPRMAPDLVAEVASPSQRRSEMRAKAQRWLDAGVEIVWVVLPTARGVEVFRSGAQSALLSVDDELSGEDVLPGFVYSVRELFA